MGLSSLKSKLGLESKQDEFSDPPPNYTEATGSPSGSPPSFAASTSTGFNPTTQLQVQAIGYDMNQALTGKTLENITAYRADTGDAEYVSMRLKKNSNSCALVRAADPAQTPLISTIYRIGPGRGPKMRILSAEGGLTVDKAIEDHENTRGELIDVKSRSMISRAQVLDTSLGKFEWRYGDRKERDAYNADNILIMERVDQATLPNGSKSERGARVAQLVRNSEFRTPGTHKNMGGNGGRLMVDLSMWQVEKGTVAQDVEAFVVASAILMLKREADRFIDNNIAAVV
ncbi:hypothetical protein CC79DRAFT_1365286 [Sarocladium strictum]